MKYELHLGVLLHRLSGLIRTRVVLSLIGLYVLNKQPQAGQYIVTLIGMAMGVSAIDAWKGKGKPENGD